MKNRMFKRLLSAALCLCMVLALFPAVSFAAEGEEDGYALNESAFTQLPMGAVEAESWLLQQLYYQKNGLTTYIQDNWTIYGPNNAWRGGNGDNWEKGPYYLRGLVSLAWTLNDQELKDQAMKWLDFILESQVSTGYFGPKCWGDGTGTDWDWWPHMVVIQTLRDYYEATELEGDPDERVMPLLGNYFRFQLEQLPRHKLSSWGASRGGDNLEVVLWYYGRTFDPENPEASEWLIDLGEIIISQTISQTSGRAWTDIFTNTTVREHVVNTTQAMKTPAVIWQMTGAEEDREALRQGLRNMGIDHGRVDNLANSDEGARENYPYRGSETCSVVESLLSNEIAIRILGEGWIGDEIESLAYNSLPVCYSSDFRSHVYFQVQNQVVATEGWHELANNSGGTAVAYGAFSGYECCFPNMHMGWPKFVQSMWMATNDDGLAVVAYGPNTVTATVAGGKTAVFHEETDYPFKDTIGLTYSGETASFPLMLRVPEWCEEPSFTVNGETVTAEVVNGYITIDREWTEGDVVTVKLPMQVRLSYWYNDAVAVKYGALTFALGVEEEWYDVGDSKAGFGYSETRAAGAWNYGLVIDPYDVESSFTVEVADEVGLQPFILDNAPIKIKVTGQLIPEWKLKSNVVPEPPYSPIAADESLQEEIELVPYGSTRLHITQIPWVGEAPEDLTTTRTMADADTYVEDGVSVVEFDNVNVRSADNYKLVVNYTGTGKLDIEINTKYVQSYEFTGEPIVIENLVNIVPTASPTSTTNFRFGYGKYNNIRFLGDSDVEITSIQVVPVNPFTAPEISRASVNAEGTMTVTTNIDREDGFWYLEYGSEPGVYTHTVENLYSRTASVQGMTSGPYYVRAYMLCNGQRVYTEEVQVSTTITDTVPNFYDDFEDPDASRKLWYVMDPNGVVTFEDGLMKVGYSNNIKATSDERSWTDYTVTAKLQGTGDPTRDFGIMVRASNFVDGADGYNGYYVGINPAGGGGLNVGYANGSWHQIAKVGGFTYNSAKVYELKVIICGERLVAYVDGAKLFDRTFTEMGTPNYAVGGVGLRSWNQGFNVDEFEVREISDEEYEALGIDPDAPVETPVDPNVPSFSDDFENAEASAEKWTEVGNVNSINIVNGKLAFTANSDVKAVAGSESWTDFVVEGDISLSGSYDSDNAIYWNGGLMYRATNVSTGADGFNGYYVGIGNARDGGYVIRGYCNGKWNQGNRITLDHFFEDNVDYHLKVVAYGQQFAIYLEDELIEVFTAAQYSAGKIGLRGWNKSFTGDNIVVREVTAADLVDIKAPVALDQVIGSYETIQVKMNNFSSANRYKIQYGTESGVYTRTVDGLYTSGRSYDTISFTVPENGTYYGRVLAINGTQIDVVSQEFVITTNQRQDLSDSVEMKDMLILLESAEAKAAGSGCVQLTWAVEYANSVKNDPDANLHEISLAKSSLEIGVRVADVDVRQDVTAVAAVDPITINMNLTAGQVAAKLPAAVEVTYGKYDQTADAKIESWVCESYDSRTPGEYVFTGILAESDDYANANGLTAQAIVTVTNVDRYEAELAVFTAPANAKIRDFASNGALVGTIDNANATVTFTVWADVAGTYDMAISYTAHTSYPNPTHKVIINGEEMMVHYTQMATWNDLFTQSVEIELNEGENTIVFTHSGLDKSFAELDCIELSLIEKAPDPAVLEVIELIDAIGEVTLESGEAIDAARTAYDALTEEQKAQVTNYQTLLDAEHEYVLLLAEDYVKRAEAAAEAAQKAYEEAQAAYEKAMAEVAEDKTAAENAKKEAEAAKAAAEEAQKKAEEARSAAEAAKAAAEENRDKAAAEALKAAEEATKAAESAQLAAEYAAKTAEALAKAQEAQAAAEAAQKEAEESAREAEEARKAAEEAEEEAAQKRKEAEEAAEAAKEAQRKAELANAKFLALYELTVLTRDIDTDDLNEHELAELEKVLDELTAAIDAAETEEEVAEALAEAKAAIEAALGICPSAKFTDVVDGAWYHEGVDFMIGNGYMNGVADTAFAPNADTTRGMMVTLLYRLAGEPSVDGLTNPFEDVAEDAWYTNAVIWAVSEGIVNGKSETVFDPNAAVTRQEMVTMLWRYAGQPETEATLEGYTDAGSVGNFAATAMAWAVENGIITGVTDTELAPTGTATRAQIATVLMRYIEK